MSERKERVRLAQGLNTMSGSPVVRVTPSNFRSQKIERISKGKKEKREGNSKQNAQSHKTAYLDRPMRVWHDWRVGFKEKKHVFLPGSMEGGLPRRVNHLLTYPTGMSRTLARAQLTLNVQVMTFCQLSCRLLFPTTISSQHFLEVSSKSEVSRWQLHPHTQPCFCESRDNSLLLIFQASIQRNTYII